MFQADRHALLRGVAAAETIAAFSKRPQSLGGSPSHTYAAKSNNLQRSICVKQTCLQQDAARR